MQIIPEKRNESNLFREKEALDSVKEIRIENL
jgi:hypothetical protein